MLQPFILGIAMFWFMRMLGVSLRGALFSAVALVLSGFSVVRLEYGEFLYVLSGLPLLLGITEALRNNPGSRIRVWIPVTVAVVLLSGQPHMILYVLGLFALYVFLRVPIRECMRIAGYSALGVGIAAIQLLPSFELYLQSTITRENSGFIFEKFLLPIGHLVTILVPNFFGNQATYNYFGPHDYTETVAYIGSVPVLFALFAIRRIRNNVPVRFFTVVTLISILATLSWLGTRFLFSLPIPVLSADVPSRVFVLTAFAVCVLSGMGIDAWEHAAHRTRRIWMTGAGLFLAGILGVAFLLYRMHAPCPTVISGCRMISIRTTLIELATFVSFAAAAFLSVRNGAFKRLQAWVPLGIVIVIGLYNAQKFIPFSPRERVLPELPVISALKDRAGLARVAGLGTGAIRSNLFAVFGIFSPEYFDPLHVKRYAELVSYVNTGNRSSGLKRSDVMVISDPNPSDAVRKRRDRFWDISGTSFLLINKNDGLNFSGSAEWSDDSWSIYRRATAMPRAYFVSHLREAADPDKALSLLFSKDIDTRSTAVTNRLPPGWDERKTATGTAIISSYSPHRVLVRTGSYHDSFLVVSDTYYPGWKAYVDGNEREIYPANVAFRGVVVPKGDHTVEFRYEPGSVRWGVIIASGSLLLWFVFLVQSFRTHEENQAHLLRRHKKQD